MPEGGFFGKFRKKVAHSEAQKTADQVEQKKAEQSVSPQGEIGEVSVSPTPPESVDTGKKHPLDFCHGVENFEAVLSKLNEDVRVEGCVLANWEGLLVAEDFPSYPDTKPIASLSSMMCQFTDKWLSKLSREKAVIISVETDERTIILKRIAQLTLIIFAKKDGQPQSEPLRIEDASDAIMWILQNRYGE